jgi:hypothetical protein
MTKPLFVVCDVSGAKKVFEYGGSDILMSYWFLKSNPDSTLRRIKEYGQPGIFMLDSGAFSAWKNGSEILLYDYIDFIKKYHYYFTHIVCLDVIDNPIYSEVNHLIMLDELEGLGLEIIPVFHSGEPFAALDYMVEKGYKYLGISPNNNWREETKRIWLHRVFFRYDFEKLGIKTHGFGYQSISGLLQFPMTTADAATWKVGEMFGRIIEEGGKSYYYTEKASHNRDYIDKIIGGESKFIKDLCNEIGVTSEQLRVDYHARDKFNVAATIKLLKSEKVHISIPVDLLAEVDSSFGYCDDFSEDKVLTLYHEMKQLRREYSGGPKSDKKHIKQKTKATKKAIVETLF